MNYTSTHIDTQRLCTVKAQQKKQEGKQLVFIAFWVEKQAAAIIYLKFCYELHIQKMRTHGHILSNTHNSWVWKNWLITPYLIYFLKCNKLTNLLNVRLCELCYSRLQKKSHSWWHFCCSLVVYCRIYL